MTAGKRPAPLPDDPDVRARIRPMTATDVPQVAALHEAAMGRSLWASLGGPFLRAVYDALVGVPEFLAYVYVENGRVLGFIAGSTDGPRLLRRALRRRPARIAWAAARSLAGHPKAAVPLLGTFLYFRRSRVSGLEEVRAESMFCSFVPELRGKRISGLINQVLFEELARRGHRYVKITTESDNAGAVRQLTSWGFERLGAFRHYGKEMIAWRLDLAASERVRP
jgi:ribosomal protein S18 acetylase RimI-like enzyme